MKISVSWFGGERKRYCPYCEKYMTEKISKMYYCKKCKKSFRGRKIKLGICTIRISFPRDGVSS